MVEEEAREEDEKEKEKQRVQLAGHPAAAQPATGLLGGHHRELRGGDGCAGALVRIQAQRARGTQGRRLRQHLQGN